ncbi:putative brct domain-containing protein [Golovinomyces cichoracearum]|uniref:Putative brct domain-containing protein n=1 Tax=Golovinomyces cichoracearum TaxID=62708 RepID=A0A420J1H8_9PEZI|nr:putative brct domain-containing protein [Golovinomyces cichoracearum]
MSTGNNIGLWENCVFAIVLSPTLPKSRGLDLKKDLELQGAKVENLGSKIEVQNLTHIISETIDFPEYASARQHMIPVVIPDWIAHSLMRNKEAGIRPYTPDPALIFSSVNISCADIPTGDKDAIIGAVLAMGGVETNSLTKLTTHICALTIDHPKCQHAIVKKLNCKIILPHWFDDCLKLGKRIDEGPYLLPDPEIFRKKPEDDLPMPQCDTVKGATSPRPGSILVPTDSPSRCLTVFKKKKIMISNDLELSNRSLKVIQDLIIGSGGSITANVRNANIFVCHWRDGDDYRYASKAGLDVGNLSWLYHLIAHNVWTSPLRRLLHYPLPRNGIPGFEKYRITLSNYGGEARTYLENLVIAAGAEFTKSMKQDNTHLITARRTSEKCQAAQEWGIEMINHLWIEESYARCAPQMLTDPRYTHFPPRTNLGEIIGQTQLDLETLEQLYYPSDLSQSSDSSGIVRKSPKIPENKKHASSTTDNTMDTGEETSRSEENIALSVTSSRPSDLSHLETPSNSKSKDGWKDNTPSSTGSRNAKNKAVNRLHGMASDIALYEKEKKRKGAVWGGERAATMIEKQGSLDRSFSPLIKHVEANNESLEEGPVPRVAKRVKNAHPPAEIRLIITGYKRWLQDLPKETADTKILRHAGILVTQNSGQCTHLAAPSMVRTKKFLCALASGPIVVSTDFIDACIKDKDVPNVEDYLLKDSENEKKFGVKLKDALVRARENKHSLLRRIPVYCTEAVPNKPETYKDIVEANGGTFGIFRGRPIIKKSNSKDDDPAEPVYLLSGVSKPEKLLWPKFTKMARDGNMIPRIVMTEWLLDVAMVQLNKWDNKYLLFNE